MNIANFFVACSPIHLLHNMWIWLTISEHLKDPTLVTFYKHPILKGLHKAKHYKDLNHICKVLYINSPHDKVEMPHISTPTFPSKPCHNTCCHEWLPPNPSTHIQTNPYFILHFIGTTYCHDKFIAMVILSKNHKNPPLVTNIQNCGWRAWHVLIIIGNQQGALS